MPSTNKTVPWGLSQFVPGDSPGMPDWNEDCKRTNDALEEVKNIRAALAPPRGRYDTYELLKAAHPTGEAGEAYLVGAGADLYIWDVDQADWIPAGNLQGVPGPNEITTATATPLSGVLVGKDGYVKEGVADEDFAAPNHTHGNISNDGKVGMVANLPVFTGPEGAVGTKSVAEARAALGFGKTLLSGASIGLNTPFVVAGSSEYSIFIVVAIAAGTLIAFRQSATHVVAWSIVGTDTAMSTMRFVFTTSGDTWTLASTHILNHLASSGHGEMSINDGTRLIQNIVGIA